MVKLTRGHNSRRQPLQAFHWHQTRIDYWILFLRLRIEVYGKHPINIRLHFLSIPLMKPKAADSHIGSRITMHGVSQNHELRKLTLVLQHELIGSAKANVAASTISSDDNLGLIDFQLV